jgi:hypothetical protein
MSLEDAIVVARLVEVLLKLWKGAEWAWRRLRDLPVSVLFWRFGFRIQVSTPPSNAGKVPTLA